jgi:MFS transporter, DHA1 family, multidrug resistance protein
MSSRTTPPAPTDRAPAAGVVPPGVVPVSGAAPTPQYRPNAKYVLLLGLMCALPAISTDIYLPSLPDVARDLHTSATAAQLTMTAMLIGGARASW